MENIDYRQISFDYVCEVDDCFYVSSGMFNGLLKINKKNNQAEYICSFPNEAECAVALHHKIYRFEDMLVFAPNNACGIHIYHLNIHRMDFYPIDTEKHIRNRCIDSFIINDKLWLFYAFVEHAVVIFDLKTFQMDFFYRVMDALPQAIVEREKTAVFWSTLVQLEGKVYGVIWNSPYVAEIDVISRAVNIYNLGEKELHLSAISCDSNSIWVAEAKTKTLWKWDLENGVTQKYVMREQYLKSCSYFCNLIWSNNKLLVLFDDLESVFYVNEEHACIDELCSFPEGFRKMDDMRSKVRRFFNVEILSDRVRLFPISTNMMLEIDVQKALISGYSIRLVPDYDEEWYMKNFMGPFLKKMYSEKCIIEGEDVSLKTYLKII